jgi:peptidoglycan/xylan/chitin deacetylase (PgdA/CDA1 family)
MRLPGSLGTRGLKGAVRRASAIARRHGFTSARMLRRVSEFTRTALAYGIQPTFPIIASRSVSQCPALRDLQEAGAVFASHGLRHVDYTLLPKSHQAAEIGRAVETLASARIHASGFRAPYLRTNDDLREVVADQGFGFDSSEAVLWPLAEEYAEQASARAVVDFYGARTADCGPLPADGRVVRIPVSLPDDEMCVERLGLPPEAVARQWCRNLREAFDQGAVYVLQLHPERFALLREAAEELMGLARSLSPRLWLATPYEIAQWWRRREQARVRLDRLRGQWVARVEGAAEVRLELADCGQSTQSAPGREKPPAREVAVGTSRRPAVGLSPRTGSAVARRLGEEGFHCEPSDDPAGWNCYLDLSTESDEMSRAELLRSVTERASGPLVKLSHWPNGCQAAFSVTGDIDALCLPDFLSRLRG